MRLLAALAVLATLAGADDPPPTPTPTLDGLGVEATKSRAESPDRWAGYREQVDRAEEKHAKLLAEWRKRSAPPPLDFKPLGLPLAFLVDEARRLGDAPDAIDPETRVGVVGPPPVRLEKGRVRRFGAYLDAIAGHPDDRRIAALLEYRDAIERRWPGIGQSIPWAGLLSRAATRDWAIGQIRDLAREAPALDPLDRLQSLPFPLIDRFAGDLPPDVATIAYDYLRAQNPHGPGSSDRIWDVLFRLDPPRARREVLQYLDKPGKQGASSINFHVVRLLEKHAGPSTEVAEAARIWLAKEDLDPSIRRSLREILLRADPEREVKPAVEHIDRLLAELARKGGRFPFGGDVHRLGLALGQVDTKEADDALARYIFDRTIDEGVRGLMLEPLVRHDYPGAPALVARWLVEAAPHLREYVRKQAAENWGDSGRRLLEQIDREK